MTRTHVRIEVKRDTLRSVRVQANGAELCVVVLGEQRDPPSMNNHELIDGPPRWRERLGGLTQPTLVIHGREDPLLPYEHGAALAREIPGARLLALEHAGHELPREDLDVVIPAILQHTAP